MDLAQSRRMSRLHCSSLMAVLLLALGDDAEQEHPDVYDDRGSYVVYLHLKNGKLVRVVHRRCQNIVPDLFLYKEMSSRRCLLDCEDRS